MVAIELVGKNHLLLPFRLFACSRHSSRVIHVICYPAPTFFNATPRTLASVRSINHDNTRSSKLTIMFFTGDLQSGIALALRESKSVACFVADDGEESVRWENDYLKDPQVTSALRSKSVALRIQAGSQEAGFLAAYYPVPQVPSLMIIQCVPSSPALALCTPLCAHI